MNGMLPIAEIEFADFIWPTFNQIVGEAARARYGSEGTVSVPMVLRAPYGGGVRGGLYHSQSPEAYFAHTPGSQGRRSGHPVRHEGAAQERGARPGPGGLLGA